MNLLAVGVAVGIAFLAAALGTAYMLLVAGPSAPDVVDRVSYTKGWTYVNTFQPRTGVTAGYPAENDFYLGPMTDAEMLDRCGRYATDRPVAEMDGVTDPQAFLLGCTDAVRSTDLEAIS